MGMINLRQKVREQQEQIGKKFHSVDKHHSEWVENVDRWVAGFLEKFEEGCHIMETAVKDKIQESLERQYSRSPCLRIGKLMCILYFEFLFMCCLFNRVFFFSL